MGAFRFKFSYNLLLLFFTLNFVSARSLSEVHKSIIAGNNLLAGNLYETLKTHPNNDTTNFVACPLCLTLSLAMTATGASGQTLTDLEKLLKVTGHGQTEYLQGYRDLNDMYKKNIEITKPMISSIFAPPQVQINHQFQSTLASVFGSAAPKLNEGNLAATFSSYLNSSGVKLSTAFAEGLGADSHWTHSNQSDPTTDSSSSEWRKNQITLLNYYHFEAGWEKRFSYLTTTEEPFYVTQDQVLPVKMMRQSGHFYMINFPQLNARAISLPYLICDGFHLFPEMPPANRTLRSKPKRRKTSCKSGVKDSRLHLIVLLPNSYSNGLQELESKLKPYMLAKIPSKFEYKNYLDISMPKFRLESSENLARFDEQLGLQRAAGPDADFSKMSSTPLKLGDVYHHVSFTSKEKGSFTKSSILKSKPLAREALRVKLDRPFMAFVHDKKTDIILLVMKVVRPIWS